MKYEIKLLQSDIVNSNGRYYSKECMEEIEEQLNLWKIPIVNNATFNPSFEVPEREIKIIGKVINAHHKGDILYANVDLQCHIKQKFINICLIGKTSLVSDKLRNHFKIYDAVTEPKVKLLYTDNSSSFFKSSNIKKNIKMIDNE